MRAVLLFAVTTSRIGYPSARQMIRKRAKKMLVTQYEGSVIEDTGLIKMDFLGLKTLSIIKEAIENIRLHRGLELDIDQISISGSCYL